MNGSVGTVTSSDINNEEYYSKLFTNQYTSRNHATTTSGSCSQVDIKENISVLPVKEILRDHVLSLNVDDCETDGENAFFVADLGVIHRQHIRWKVHLPRVEPFYGNY